MSQINWGDLFDGYTVRNLEVHTGNVIDELKRKTALNSTEELLECVGFSLTSWVPESSESTGKTLNCINNKHPVKIDKEERKDLKVTVKVFLNAFDTTLLEISVAKALEELDVTYIESVIVAFPPTEHKLALDEIKPIWETLELLVDKKKILAIGISDLDTDQLMKLHHWARVKPIINQINLASCCVIPPEMQQFAKDNDIQLLTHNDQKELLPEEQLTKWMKSKFENLPSEISWKPVWMVRFSALVKCRGVIQNKGYIALFQGSK
ncbi:hypothetical protein CHUAL_009298 [Chamberlinius hualienensis]